MQSKVFISYRRDDSRYQARMIYSALCQTVTREHVFMDVDSIPLGANFRKILKDWVDQCEVLLALIGQGWVDANDPKTSRRRLESADDFVRIEISEALARGIPVVPVLLDGAAMPDRNLLPDDMKELVDRQAEFVEYRTFDADVERLIRKLRLSRGGDPLSGNLELPRIVVSSPEQYRRAERPIEAPTETISREDADALHEQYLAGEKYVSTQELEKAAATGHVGAQYHVGLAYEEGIDVTQDYATAAHFYQLAADQGDAQAHFNLGCLYEEGRGVAEDQAQAAQHFRIAVDGGNELALGRLASMYDQGRGVPRNPAEAKRLRKLAVRPR